jgi:hypothetical protein
MKEPVRPIHKSHRVIGLNKCISNYSYFEQAKHKTTVYLLIQKFNQAEPSDFTIIKYLSINSNSQFTYLPIKKPEEYLTNKTNILCDTIIELNEHVQIHVYWLRSIEITDIFNYKINYIQIPIFNQAKSYIKTLFETKKIYYQDKFRMRNTINFFNAKLELLDNNMEEIDSIMSIGNMTLI